MGCWFGWIWITGMINEMGALENGAGRLRVDGGRLLAHLGVIMGSSCCSDLDRAEMSSESADGAAAIWLSQIGADEENDPERFGFAGFGEKW
ncbi:hypothetical protein ACLOJK_022772 [Asimina triloba]